MRQLDEFINKVVSSDETWDCHVTPGLKQKQSMVWRHSQSTKVKIKQELSAQKIMCTGTDIFFCLLNSVPAVRPY